MNIGRIVEKEIQIIIIKWKEQGKRLVRHGEREKGRIGEERMVK